MFDFEHLIEWMFSVEHELVQKAVTDQSIHTILYLILKTNHCCRPLISQTSALSKLSATVSELVAEGEHEFMQLFRKFVLSAASLNIDECHKDPSIFQAAVLLGTMEMDSQEAGATLQLDSAEALSVLIHAARLGNVDVAARCLGLLEQTGVHLDAMHNVSVHGKLTPLCIACSVGQVCPTIFFSSRNISKVNPQIICFRTS